MAEKISVSMIKIQLAKPYHSMNGFKECEIWSHEIHTTCRFENAKKQSSCLSLDLWIGDLASISLLTIWPGMGYPLLVHHMKQCSYDHLATPFEEPSSDCLKILSRICCGDDFHHDIIAAQRRASHHRRCAGR